MYTFVTCDSYGSDKYDTNTFESCMKQANQVARQLKKTFRHLSGVQRALLLYVVLPILAVVGVGLGIGLERLSEQESEQLKSEMELIGRAIHLPVGEALVSGNHAAVERALDSVFDIGRVYGASVFDADGNRVAAAGIAERDLTTSEVAREVVMTGEQQDRMREISGLELYSHFVPVFDEIGQPNGFIQINRRASDFDASFARLSRFAWLAWGALALLTIAIVIFGHYGAIGRHVNRLKETMSKVSQGARDPRAAVDGPSEIAEIARGLNQMLDSIAEKDQELADHRAHEKELARRLEHQERMAAIGRVASGIAHELGAPLTVIDGRARRLQKNAEDPEEQRQLNAIRGQVARLTRIVRQLLNYCRPAASQAHTVKLAELLQESVASVQHEAPRDAPAVVLRELTPLNIHGDEARLELALVNVLRNAQQEGHRQVSVSLEQEHQEAVIRIRDDGRGLDPAVDKEQLLQPFYTTKGQGEGTGLGLAIVANVMLEHQGSLDLQNHAAGGCEVILRIPLWQEATANMEQEQNL